MADQSERRGFTPGPLSVDPGDSVLHILDSKRRRIATVGSVPYWMRYTERDAANAYLYAAAPDLYGALRQAVDYSAQAHEPDEPWWMREARAALAKAKGRDTGGEHE